MKYKNIVWDFDGTLACTYSAIVKIIQKVLHSFEIYESDEWILETIRTETTATVVNYCIEKYHKFTKDEFFEIYNALNNQIENYESIVLIDGVLEVLKYIKENGGKNYVVTNRQENLFELLKILKVENYFDGFEFVGKGGFKDWKPSPNMFIRLMRDYKIDPSSVLTVGDRKVDLEAGINAKLPVCLYDAILDEDDPKPDFVISDYSELISILSNKD